MDCSERLPVQEIPESLDDDAPQYQILRLEFANGTLPSPGIGKTVTVTGRDRLLHYRVLCEGEGVMACELVPRVEG